jgi:hypothetical protein
MVKRIFAASVVVLATSAGVAYAATQLTSKTVTQVCVNNANGMMRAASVCRDGEHAATIGESGGGVQVTQNGTFTVPAGQTLGRKTLPLTGITVSGKCEYVGSPPAPSPIVLARLQLQAASGKTLDAFAEGFTPSEVIQGDSLVTNPLSAVSTPSPPATEHSSGVLSVVVTSNGATATITAGGDADWSDQTCTYLWQAVEAPN